MLHYHPSIVYVAADGSDEVHIQDLFCATRANADAAGLRLVDGMCRNLGIPTNSADTLSEIPGLGWVWDDSKEEGAYGIVTATECTRDCV